MTILAYAKRASNAELIAEVAQLGYLRPEWLTLDPTYGYGTFWKQWRPDRLVACDLDPSKSELGPVDFTALPFRSQAFDAVVFDPPYKLNGTPSAPDERYGVHVPARWQDRMQLICDGISECLRVARRVGLIKCQDQVVSGEVRWQTRIFADHAEAQGFRLVDRLDLLGHRPQPEGRRQVHARRNSSTLLIFEAVA